MKHFYLSIVLFSVSFLVSAQVEKEGTPVKNLAIIKKIVDITEPQSNDFYSKSGVTARPISASTTPTGSSSETGITDGELTVSLTGNANYSIPIAIPLGINGVEPKISLDYNSQSELNGNAARGWDISGVSAITRIPATKFHDGIIDPVDFDNLDRFALDGQRLIVTNGGAYGADGTEYGTENFSNIKVTSKGVNPSGANFGPVYFRVEYPDGSIAEYGNTYNIYGSSFESRTLNTWSITYWQNAQNIRINYLYAITNNVLRLTEVSYGGVGNTGENLLNTIQFTYKDRINPIQYYIGDNSFINTKMVDKMWVNSFGVAYRNYSLISNSRDQITSITEKTGDNSKSYNPTVFEYDNSLTGTISYLPITTTLNVGNVTTLNASTVSGDFDADGKMDCLLYPTTGPDAKAKYWLYSNIESGVNTNIGVGHDVGAFEDIFTTTWLSWNNKVMPQGWTVAKKTDTNYNFTVYCMSLTLPIIQQYDRVVSFPTTVATQTCGTSCSVTGTTYKIFPKKILSGDFNGDGLTDVIAIDMPMIRQNIGCTPDPRTERCISSTSSTTIVLSKKAYFIDLKRDATNFLFDAGELLTALSTSAKVDTGDFNGDGKSDIFVFESNYVKIYTLNNTNALVLLYQNTIADTGIIVAKQILMGDYNGDGKSDFMISKSINTGNWIRYTSTGVSLLREEKSYTPVFYGNDSYNSYNFVATDYNNDSKTDLVSIKSSRNTANTLGNITVACYPNVNGNFTVTPAIGSTGDKADINIYALPVYLPLSQQSSNNGVNTVNSLLEIAFFNQNKVHFFKCSDDYKKDNLLTNITTGDGVQEAVTYIPLDQKYTGAYPYSGVYYPTTGVSNYPNLDITINPSLFIVSKIEKRSKDVYKKRFFGYYGAVSNLEGLGFLGFRGVSQTDWHDDTSPVFSSVYKNDVDLRGANIENYTVPYISYPSGGSTPPEYITNTITSYNTVADALQTNKVFKLKTLSSKQLNTLTNVNIENTDIVYDGFNNVTSSKTYTREGGTLIQTVINSITYQGAITSPYILGRPSNKSESVSADGHTMINNEAYTYNGNQLLSNIDKSASGTATISTGFIYDSKGNVTKKTIATPAQSRITNYEYDTSGRFITKITDNDQLFSTYEYDQYSGMLKKETNSLGLSMSYTYDSWYKKLTSKNDVLNKIISTGYSKSGEKTIITTTTDAADGSAIEETYDDLGRKIKMGTKDLNGSYSYVSYLYDIFDRNYKISEPYFGSSPSQWNETKFDTYSRPIQNIVFNGRSISTSYSGLTATITDGLKNKIITKNAIGDVSTINETIGGSISYSYFANGGLKQSTYNGIDLKIEQDGWGRRTKVIDPSAGTFTYTNNDFGELTEQTSQNGAVVTTITRDVSGRPTKKTVVGGGSNTETNYTYNASKVLLTISFKDLNEPSGTNETLTTYTYDATFKRPTSVVEEKFGVSKFTKSFLYDGMGRITTETKTAELGGKTSSVTTKNVYKNGDLHQILDINDKVIWQTNTVSAKGQILESVTGNSIKMTNTYDSNGYLSKIQHDKTSTPIGNIITLTTAFDKNTDNLTSRINSAFGNYTESFKYDEINRLTKFTNKSGVEETQNYDASGKITSNNLGTYDYDPTKKYQNTAISLNPEATGYYAEREGVFNDSMEEKIGWGAARHPTSNFYSFDETLVPHAQGKSTLKLANTTITEQYVHCDKWIAIDNAVPTEYTFSAWVYSDGPQAEMFLFMKTAQEAGYFTLVNSVTTNVTNQWKKIEATYSVPANIKKLNIRLDNNGFGNIWFDDVQIRKTSNTATTDRKLNVTYNAFKNPVSIEETGIDKISFTYNERDQRSTMYYGGLESDKFLRPLRKHYSSDATMEVKQNILTGAFEFITYIAGDGYTAPIAVKSDGVNPANFLYLHRDYQGTILAITNDNGDVVEKRLFDAWGAIIKVQDQNGTELQGLTVLDRGYTGHEHLQSVGLINMNARLYDPLIHRFLQVDNNIQDPTNTQNYNQYGYVLNNPLQYTDPSGNAYTIDYTKTGGSCNCGTENGELSNGQQTFIGNAIKSIVDNWDDWGIKDWAKKNLNFKRWGVTDWTKKNLNLKNWGNGIKSLFGGGHKDSGPPPNMSNYVNFLQEHYSYTSTHQTGTKGQFNSGVGDQLKFKTYASLRIGQQKMFEINDTFFNGQDEGRNYQFNLGQYSLNYRPKDNRVRYMAPTDRNAVQGVSLGADGIGWHYNIRNGAGRSGGFDVAFRPGGYTVMLVGGIILAVLQPESIIIEGAAEEIVGHGIFAF
jgi:RHS repeat-associated protein